MSAPDQGLREVICADAVQWLDSFPESPGHSFLASLPDFSEFPSLSLAEWKSWFIDVAGLVLRKTSTEGVTIFFQSDIKIAGTWVDKAYLVQKAAEGLGHELLFHKIFCRAPANVITFGRPAYSHLLCFSRSVRLDPAASTVDVHPQLGAKTWARGMGLEASLFAADVIVKHTSTRTLVNPFCGEGSALAAANHRGLRCIGIERSPKRAAKARVLQVTSDGTGWLE